MITRMAERKASMSAGFTPALEHVNEVRLVGRVSADPELMRLPSGDMVAMVRLVVERPRPPAGRSRRQKSDVLACAAWAEDVRRTVMRWCAGDVVEASGALHRRFWRADGGPQSKYEVQLTGARRLYRPPVEPPEPDRSDDDPEPLGSAAS